MSVAVHSQRLARCLLCFGAVGALAAGTTYTVTNTSSDVNTAGSLPWAVFQSNYATHGLDFINFNIPGPGIHVINVSQTLYVNDQLVINGESQPGYSGQPLIYVNGTASTTSLFLLQSDPTQGTSSSGSTIQGLGMYYYTTNAVTILVSSAGNWIQDNWMGFYVGADNQVSLDTSTFFPPTYYPSCIGIQSSYNTIRNNVLTGTYNALVMGEDIAGTWSGTVYQTNSIQGNKIGTDPTGSLVAGYGNLEDAVFLGEGAQQNFIGPDNVISGNASHGVEILHSSVKGNVIFRNLIGTDVTGSLGLGNGELGVLIANGASGNAVGGPFGGNVISANALGGVSLATNAYPSATNNYVQNNIIGLNSTQSQVIGNQGVGVSVQSGAQGNVVDSNVLAGHTLHGIVVSAATGNEFAFNWIGGNVNDQPFPNSDFGIALLSGASYNFIVNNAFETNLLGSLYVDAAAIGNEIVGPH